MFIKRNTKEQKGKKSQLEELRCKKERLIKPGMSIMTPAPQYCAEVPILGSKMRN